MEMDGSSPGLANNTQVSGKDQKHSVKKYDKQKNEKTSVEKTLEFLYSNMLKCMIVFIRSHDIYRSLMQISKLRRSFLQSAGYAVRLV